MKARYNPYQPIGYPAGTRSVDDRPKWWQRENRGSFQGVPQSIEFNAQHVAPGVPVQLPVQRQGPIGQILDPSRLDSFRANAKATDDPEIQRQLPGAQYTPGDYGDMVIIPFVFAGAGSQLVLPRPRKTRILLFIENDLVVGQIRINYGAAAAALLGIGLNPGGTMLLDARVPQNDCFVFAPNAGVVQVGYINTDIANATA